MTDAVVSVLYIGGNGMFMISPLSSLEGVHMDLSLIQQTETVCLIG